MGSSELPVRKTTITKTIARKINTAPYETLEVGTCIQQEIEWTTKEQLWEKASALDEYVVRDYQRSEQKFLTDLGLGSIQGSTPSQKNQQSPAIDKEDFDQLV